MSITVFLTHHHHHIYTELAADRGSIKALNTAYDFFEDDELPSKDQMKTIFLRVKSIFSNPMRAYHEDVLFHPDPATSINQIRKLAKKQPSIASCFLNPIPINFYKQDPRLITR